MDLCYLCPRECGADRSATVGRCGVGRALRVARAALHRGEEPCISGTRGAGTVFFSGCSLGCVYCQNDPISRGCQGIEITPERLSAIFSELAAQGAHNLDLVTPTHYTDQLAPLLENLSLPVVWNSSGYEKPDTLRLLQGRVQVFMPDCKYSDPVAAARYSAAPDYPAVARRAIRAMADMIGPPVFDADGLLVSGVLIRHLVLPGWEENTRGVIDWLCDSFAPGEVMFSLMGQYLPCGGAAGDDRIDRPLKPDEYAWAVNYLRCSGWQWGYVQDLASADAGYIPAFDGTGVLPVSPA